MILRDFFMGFSVNFKITNMNRNTPNSDFSEIPNRVRNDIKHILSHASHPELDSGAQRSTEILK